MKYHFGIIDSHTQRKRYGKVALIYFSKNVVDIKCVHPEKFASFGLVLCW